MVQAYSAWYSALSRSSPPTEIRRRHILRFPRPQDGYSIFRMQRDAFLTDATPAHEFGSMKDPLPSNTTMLPLSIAPVTASKGLRTLSPWDVTRLEVSLPPCRSVRTFAVNSYRLSIFSPPGPTHRCVFTEPFDGFRSTFGQSSWIHN